MQMAVTRRAIQNDFSIRPCTVREVTASTMLRTVYPATPLSVDTLPSAKLKNTSMHSGTKLMPSSMAADGQIKCRAALRGLDGFMA